MRQLACAFTVLCLTGSWVGCHSATESVADSNSAGSSAEAGDLQSSDFVLVSLKVPNMT